MLIKMLTTASGPDFFYDAGKVHNVPDELALEWLAKRPHPYAQRVKLIPGTGTDPRTNPPKYEVIEDLIAKPEEVVRNRAEIADEGVPQLETADKKKR